MKQITTFIALLIIPALACAEDVSFRRDVAGILATRCLGCHNNRKSEGRYALHTFELLLKAGESEEAPVIAGKPDESYLLQKLIEADADLRMPAEDDPLDAEQITLIRKWIEQGAKFDGVDQTIPLTQLLPPRVHPDPPRVYRTAIPIFAMEFTPDGKSLLTGGWHELLIWDVETGELQLRVTGLPQRIYRVAYSPDGKLLMVCGGAPGEYGEIRLFSTALLTDISLRTPASQQVASQQVSAESVSAESVSARDATVFPTWDDVVLDCKFSPDGKRLVACGADNSVRAFDISGSQLWQTKQHVEWVTAIAVTDYRFGEARTPNDKGSKLLTFSEHEKKSGEHIRQVWDFGDGKIGSQHFIVRASNWELESRSQQDADPVLTMTRITETGIGKTRQVKREEFRGEQIKQHQEILNYLQQLYESWGQEIEADRLVLSASRDRTAKAFWLRDGKLFTTYKGHRREYGRLKGMFRLYGIEAEPNSRRVWSGGEGQHFHGWNPITVRDEDGTAADMEQRFSKSYSIDLVRHEFAAPVFSLTRGGDNLFAATENGEVRGYQFTGEGAVLDINKAGTAKVFAGQSDNLFAVRTSPNNERVAAVGYRGEVVIWDTKSGEMVKRFVAAPTISATLP
jgi:WD40 repeat protein